MQNFAANTRACFIRFRRAEDGNITVMMTLAMIAATVLCGSADDYGRAGKGAQATREATDVIRAKP